MIESLVVVAIAYESVTTTRASTTIYDRTLCSELRAYDLVPLRLGIVDTSLDGHLLVIAEVVAQSTYDQRRKATTSDWIIVRLDSDARMIAKQA